MPGWLSGWAPPFGPGCDPGVPESSPTLGFLNGACFSSVCVSASLSLSFSLCVCVCISWINKIFKKKTKLRNIFRKTNTVQTLSPKSFWFWKGKEDPRQRRPNFFLVSAIDTIFKTCYEGIPGWLGSLATAFSPGRDLGVWGSSPASGSLHGACFSLCLSLFLSLSLSHE